MRPLSLSSRPRRVHAFTPFPVPFNLYLPLELPGTITTTLNDVSPAISSQEVRQYDVINALSFNCGIDNVTEIDEYDYGNTTTPVKKTAQTWMTASDSSLYSDAAGGGHVLDRLKSRTITDPASNVQSILSYGFNSVGDITSKAVGGTNVSSLTTNYQRDAYGNITQVTDPKSNITKFGYTDNWAQTTCAPPSNSSAYLTSIADALNHVTNFSYNSCTGAKASATNPNGARTSLVYDALGRTTTVNNPDGGQATSAYVDSAPNSVTVSKLINSSTNLQLQTKTILDGFSRTIQSQILSDPDGVTTTDTMAAAWVTAGGGQAGDAAANNVIEQSPFQSRAEPAPLLRRANLTESVVPR